jgi:hypothetical protein
VYRAGYSESKVETDVAPLKLETDATALKLEMDVAALQLETDMTALELEMETDVSHEISKQERYSTD